MKRSALYSGRPRTTPPPGLPERRALPTGTIADQTASGQREGAAESRRGIDADSRPNPAEKVPATGAGKRRFQRLRAVLARHRPSLNFFAGILLALTVVLGRDWLQTPARELTQDDIDAAVLHTLETKDLPSRAARAAETIRPSVVRIRGFSTDPSEPEAGLKERGMGTGVVIMEDGTLLTNLHVVAGSDELRVTFFDGSETTATLVSVQAHNDLAVLKPKQIPDDLPPATLGSSARLVPGDEVVAVGFPFGIGPSVSAGVVSGLGREFKAEEGEQALKGLIQFDAAANPGNSGGPLITLSGEVVGIVTAILNPTSARTFAGIGFAVTIESAGTAMGVPPF